MSYYACQRKVFPSLFPDHFGWHLFAKSDTVDKTQEKQFLVAIGQPGYRVERRYYKTGEFDVFGNESRPWEVVCETQDREEAMRFYNGLG